MKKLKMAQGVTLTFEGGMQQIFGELSAERFSFRTLLRTSKPQSNTFLPNSIEIVSNLCYIFIDTSQNRIKFVF